MSTWTQCDVIVCRLIKFQLSKERSTTKRWACFNVPSFQSVPPPLPKYACILFLIWQRSLSIAFVKLHIVHGLLLSLSVVIKQSQITEIFLIVLSISLLNIVGVLNIIVRCLRLIVCFSPESGTSNHSASEISHMIVRMSMI